jgi:hypothetical protein
MARVRFSEEEAQAEATRRAAASVAERADRDRWRYVSTSPNRIGPSRSSKHPLMWMAMYAQVGPDGEEIDGGELFVVVNLELGTVSVREP